MKNKLTKIIRGLIILVSAIICIYFIVSINNFGIIPSKYLMICYIAMTLLFTIIFLLITRKNKISYITGIILSIIASIGYIVGASYLNIATNTINKIVNNKSTSINYYVLVKKDSNIKNIKDLKERTVGYIKDNNSSKLKKMLTKKVDCKTATYTDYNDISSDFIEGTPIILNSGYVEALEDEMPSFNSTYKIIYTFSLEEKLDRSKEYTDITNEPILIYLSGIDTYGEISTRSRSDVNILITVNPKNHKILLVNTPRDYYVQLHNTTGLKDKLTHAGIYGIETSVTTMEDLYNVKINNYIRVNFNTLIKLVDKIGGIDINSDTAFIPHTNKNVNVKMGINHFNGEQALAYSRERYTYESGDRHRGQNQQQVITAIIDKITQTRTLMSKYDDILNTLSNSFETDLTNDEIKAFAKMQLDKNIRWNIESISVDGKGSKNHTYSMGTKHLLYVMVPNENTVKNAKEKINQVLNKK